MLDIQWCLLCFRSWALGNLEISSPRLSVARSRGKARNISPAVAAVAQDLTSPISRERGCCARQGGPPGAQREGHVRAVEHEAVLLPPRLRHRDTAPGVEAVSRAEGDRSARPQVLRHLQGKYVSIRVLLRSS